MRILDDVQNLKASSDGGKSTMLLSENDLDIFPKSMIIAILGESDDDLGNTVINCCFLLAAPHFVGRPTFPAHFSTCESLAWSFQLRDFTREYARTPHLSAVNS